MKRRANLVLDQSPREAAVFDQLERVSARCEAAGLGRLVPVRDLTIDAESARYEFALTSGRAQLWLHDDLDLDLRYVSLHGDEDARTATAAALMAEIKVLSLVALIGLVETDVARRPEWLNALALGSDSPPLAPVCQAVTRCLASADDAVAVRAVEAALLLGQDQFAAPLAQAAISGPPTVVALLRSLGFSGRD